MTIDSITRELVSDCLGRIRRKENCAAYDIASVFMGHLHEKDIDLNLAVIEALVLLAAADGCDEARIFLEEDWINMQPILKRRWAKSSGVSG